MVDNYMKIDEEELKRLLKKGASGGPATAHEFFSYFHYNSELLNQNFLATYDEIIELLQIIKRIDPNAFRIIHKGVPYYFAAICQFFLHNFEHAVYFFDAAVSEDLKNDPKANTPAKMFLQLDGNPENQAARQMTQIAEKKLQTFITTYNSIPSIQEITIVDIRLKFLTRSISDKQSWRTLATSFISFLLEWDYLIVLNNIRGEDGTWEPFYLHLFKGCVLFESLIKANPTILVTENTLERMLYKNKDIKLALGINDDCALGGRSLTGILEKISVSGLSTDIENDIILTARLRNTIGHNIGWDNKLTSKDYVKLIEKTMNSILFIIAKLY